jgi:hypothetical protein
MNIEQGIMNVEGSKVEIRMNELENSVFVRIPNHYSLFLVQYSLFPLLVIKTDIHIKKHPFKQYMQRRKRHPTGLYNQSGSGFKI